jgi:UDP-GlcNAc3NAcA epimerase
VLGVDRMSSLLAVIGTRPQFIKYAALADALERAFPTVLVDTGQHYDPQLSSLFFEELKIRRPDRVLEARRDGVAVQLADMIAGLDAVIEESRPAALVCIGDTNSTLAAALAGLKRKLRIAHIEAGERNFRSGGQRIPPWSMPEETNRIMVDQASSLLLCASHRGLANLRSEGREDEAVFTGDLMRGPPPAGGGPDSRKVRDRRKAGLVSEGVRLLHGVPRGQHRRLLSPP